MTRKFLTQIKTTLAAHKKRIWSMIVLVAILGAFSAGAHAMFQVKGVVTGIDNNSITVANFFRTQTINLADSPVNAANIKLGDKVKIQKNLQGNILYAQILSAPDSEHPHKNGHR